MEDIKTPKTELESFSFWMEDMKSQFIAAPWRGKKIPVKDASEVSLSQKMQYLYEMRKSFNLEAMAKLEEANGNLKGAHYIRTKLMEAK